MGRLFSASPHFPHSLARTSAAATPLNFDRERQLVSLQMQNTGSSRGRDAECGKIVFLI